MEKRTRKPGGGRPPKNPNGNRIAINCRIDPDSYLILQAYATPEKSQAEIIDEALQAWEKKQKKKDDGN